MKQPAVNLTTVDPKGRIDVLVYKGLEWLTRKAVEEKHGLAGVWDAIAPHAHDMVTRNVSGWEPPTELKVLLQIFQANLGKKKE